MKPGEQVSDKAMSTQARVRHSVWSRLGALSEAQNDAQLWSELYWPVELTVWFGTGREVESWLLQEGDR